MMPISKYSTTNLVAFFQVCWTFVTGSEKTWHIVSMHNYINKIAKTVFFAGMNEYVLPHGNQKGLQ